jgi:hypothetical protein
MCHRFLQVLNLFLALLLSSFSTDSQRKREQQSCSDAGSSSSDNKLLEAVERISRLCRYLKVRISLMLPRRRAVVGESKVMPTAEHSERISSAAIVPVPDNVSPAQDGNDSATDQVISLISMAICCLILLRLKCLCLSSMFVGGDLEGQLTALLRVGVS